ncbi:hypothetical protein [Actinocorallia populi]|uniref:hypothetical protein n=1 Tax=Actinocorallia populi TaxID=2079200 RepID=UPI000D093FA2|nr:hypothetical protein [Actinocorallia populi]
MSKIMRLSAGLVMAGTLLLASACGGDSGSGDGGTTGTDMSAFRDCLKKHGVSMPEGGRGGGRPSGGPTVRSSGARTDRPSGAPTGRPSGGPSMSTEMQAAMQACASLRPEAPRVTRGGPGAPGDDGGQQQSGG